MKFKPFVLLLTAILISGCINSGSSDIDGEDRIVGKAITGEDHGNGYLEEYESKIVFFLDLEENQFLTHLTFIVNWDDEPPVKRGIDYENQGDQFTLRVTDGASISFASSVINAPRTQGRAFVHLGGDVVDNQSKTGGALFTCEITLTYAGDQYPMNIPSESLRVDDTGNEYRWSMEYRYVDKDL